MLLEHYFGNSMWYREVYRLLVSMLVLRVMFKSRSTLTKQHNLKAVVKNTGHDYLGRSTARGGFLIWTHFMKDILYNSTFIPEGAPATTENTFNGDFPLPFLIGGD